MIKLILAVNSFNYPVNLKYNKEDATIEIVLMFLGAFLLGFLFRHFLGFRKKEFIIEADTTDNKTSLASASDSKQVQDLSKQIDALRSEVERLAGIYPTTISNTTNNSSTQKSALIHSPAIDSVEAKEKKVDVKKEVISEEKKTEISPISNDKQNIVEVKKEEVKQTPPPAPIIKEETKKEQITAKKDDLKVIEGIGPAIEKLLNDNGISSYEHLSKAPIKDLEKMLDEAGPRFRVHVPETWPEQAKLLQEGKMEAFKALTEALKGGRRV